MKIFAVGMNYIQHNKELDGALYKPEKPVIFTKADSALLKDHKPFFIPDWSEQVDYETELVVRICRLGKSIPERFAHRYYDAVTVGIDFTARDLQREARSQGHPWEICKGFDGSAVIGEWVDINKFRDIQAIHFHLDINGKTVQEGCSSDMLYKVDELPKQAADEKTPTDFFGNDVAQDSRIAGPIADLTLGVEINIDPRKL